MTRRDFSFGLLDGRNDTEDRGVCLPKFLKCCLFSGKDFSQIMSFVMIWFASSLLIKHQLLFYHGNTALMWQGLLIFEDSWSHSVTPTTLGRTPLDEWSARRRDLYRTTHNKHNRYTFTPPAGFEPTIPASERPQTHVLDREATGIGKHQLRNRLFSPSPLNTELYVDVSFQDLTACIIPLKRKRPQ
jgi:hypothetical protein